MKYTRTYMGQKFKVKRALTREIIKHRIARAYKSIAYW